MSIEMNLDNYCRKVIVHYGGKTSCIGKKLFILPAITTIGRRSDLEILREKIHKEIMAHPYLQQYLGGNKSTKVHEVCIFQYEECFSQPEEFLLGPTDVLSHRDENLIAKIIPEVIDGLLFSSQPIDISNSGEETELTSTTNSQLSSNNGIEAPSEIQPLIRTPVLDEPAKHVEDPAGHDPGEGLNTQNGLDNGVTKNQKSGEAFVPADGAVEKETNWFPSETVMNIAGDNIQPFEVVVRPLALPKEGDSPGDLTPILVVAIQQQKLKLHFDEFVRTCAIHLSNTQPNRSKAIYAQYARMIVDEYGKNNPCVYDRNGQGSDIIKTKIVRAIGNRKGSIKFKEERRVKRIQKKRKMLTFDSVPEIENGGVVVENIDEAADSHTAFVARRQIVEKGGVKVTTQQILEDIPDYNEFPKVYEEFVQMLKPGVSVAIFKDRILKLMENFRKFLQSNIDCPTFPDGEDGNLLVLLEINRMSSTQRGVNLVPPVFLEKKVGQPFDPSPNGANPYAVLFWEGPKIHSMLIVGGGALNYKNIVITNVWEALFNLLAVYYVIFLEYPATYGLLDVVDRYCLKPVVDGGARTGKEPKSKKKKKGKKDFQCITNFLSKFEKFLKNESEVEDV